MNRKIYYWKLRTTELQLGERTLIMGVLNITPDSFSDGGRFLDPDRAYARAMEMEEQGVDIIDIGAESTRPESKRITADEEWQRLVPVLKRLRDQLTVPISLDTYKSEIAERALEYGVQILNDPSGLTFDADLAKVAANGNAGLILNHMRGTPETWGSLPPMPDAMGVVSKDLDATTSRARRSGVEKNRIVIDPGLGFGKRKEQNSEILAQLGRLADLDYPILIAPSRKTFLTHTGDGGETVFATAAAVTAGILNGAHIVRVHDIKEMRAAVLMADEIAKLGTPPVKDEDIPLSSERPVRPRGPKALPPYMGEEKHQPMRPPILRPVARPVLKPILSVTPVTPEEVKPADKEAATDETPIVPVVEGAAVPAPVEAKTPPVAAGAEDLEGDELDLDELDSGDSEEEEDDDAEAEAAEPKPAAPKLAASAPVKFVKRPPQTAPSKGWTPASRPPFGDRGPRKDFGDRPPRQDYGDRPSRPPFGDRGPRKDFGDRPPRQDFGGDRPARPPFGDRPPRKDFGDRPPRKDFGDRPPRQDFGGDRPPRPPFSDRGPRKDFGGDRPPRRDFGGDRGGPPDRGGSDRGDRPSRPPFGDRPPRGPEGGPGRGSSGGGGFRPPSGRPPQRPFRKRP